MKSEAWLTDGNVEGKEDETDEFVAFDRHSPADPNAECEEPLYPDTDNFLILKDSCSGATFSLYDGSPINGSEYGLMQYACNFNGNSIRACRWTWTRTAMEPGWEPKWEPEWESEWEPGWKPEWEPG